VRDRAGNTASERPSARTRLVDVTLSPRCGSAGDFKSITGWLWVMPTRRPMERGGKC
jgi:hypothetical protein